MPAGKRTYSTQSLHHRKAALQKQFQKLFALRNENPTAERRMKKTFDRLTVVTRELVDRNYQETNKTQ